MGALSGNREMLGDCKSISMEHPTGQRINFNPFQMIEVKLPKAFLSLWDAVQELGWTGPAWEEWSTGEQSQMWFPGQRDESLLTLYLPQPSRNAWFIPKEPREIFGESGLEVKEVSRYLSIILAGTFQLSWPGPACWNHTSNATEKMQFPLCTTAHYQEKWWLDSLPAGREPSISFGSLW